MDTRTGTGSSTRRPDWLCDVIPPVITPFTASGGVDRETLAGLVDRLVRAGVRALFALGSSSETAYLTDAQRREVIMTVREAAAGRVPLLAGCIDTTAARVIEQARTAQELGADALVATAPFYAVNDPDEVADHYRAIHAAVDLPLVAYDIPVRVHTKLTVDTLITLGREGVIVGLKDSSGDDIAFRRLVLANREAGAPLALLTGHETMCDAMALIGADGVVPGLGNVDPDGYVRLWNAARAGDWPRAVAEQEQLTRLFMITTAAPNRSVDVRGIGTFKTAMVHLGSLPSARIADPVQGLTPEETEAVLAIVRAWQSHPSAVR